MKLTIELEVNKNTLPHIFSELEHKTYQLHLLGFSRANISLMLGLDYSFVKRTIINKREVILTMLRQAYKEREEIEEMVKNNEIEVCDRWREIKGKEKEE